MQWAIVCTAPMTLGMWVWNGLEGLDSQNVWTEAEVPTNTIINIIEYDGVSEFNPPENTVLMEVADDKQIGDLAS